MRFVFNVLAVLLISARASAAPIMFTTSGAIAGSVFSTPTHFSASEASTTSSWMLSGAADGIQGQLTNTVLGNTVTASGLSRAHSAALSGMFANSGGSYLLQFDIVEPTAYTFQGFWFCDNGNQLASTTGSILSSFTSVGQLECDGVQPFSSVFLQGELPPGNYFVSSNWQTSAVTLTFRDPFPDDTFAFMNLTLSLTPQAVPEPASLMLLGSGLLATGFKTRRRVRGQTR